ncbi:hypothetical protein M902_2343 [Bacteriovorax sp. BAL6_X]|uniref:hypothetical protein n=1 Tax=Bacteriovorax sp. BAL6_X TaxID=1201290 RepID=UPI000385BAFA|nr:hypothetical protein [Bacteriovorax sp. BAL6_X]EPZ51892.1 hypothetical protein M902_2343 [Bacteriovorax sp. BAL6_X]
MTDASVCTRKRAKQRKTHELPIEHFKNWEDYFTIQVASIISNLTKTSLYEELEFITDKSKKWLAPRITRGLRISTLSDCEKGLQYLRELLIPSLENSILKAQESMKLLRLKEEILRCSYKELHGVEMPNIMKSFDKHKSNSQPEFVQQMLVCGVFGEVESKIQYDKTGLFQKLISPFESEHFFKEYFNE